MLWFYFFAPKSIWNFSLHMVLFMNSIVSFSQMAICLSPTLCTKIHVYQYRFEHHFYRGFPLVAQTVKHLPVMRETWVWSLGREDPLEKGTATDSSTLAWRTPWMENPGRLQSMGCKESDKPERLNFLSFLSLLCTKPKKWREFIFSCLLYMSQ